jgi:phage protein D/phage baseplate assembly protein gpV
MPDNVAQFHVKVGGESLPAHYAQQLHSLTVESSLNMPSVAEVTLLDAKIEFIDGDILVPGKALQIFAKAGPGEEQKIFDGEIVELEPNFEYPNAYCVVRAFDRLHKLMRGQFVRDFPDAFDSDIAAKVAEEAKLKPKVHKTTPKHDYVFQDNETNLAFLQRRAAVLGYVIYVDGANGDDFHFEPLSASRQVDLKWGKDGLSVFRPRLTTLSQPTKITVAGWDPMRAEPVSATPEGAGKGQPIVGEPKDRVAMAKVFGESSALLSTTIRNVDYAKAVANGEANRRSGEYLQAEGTCGGHPGLTAGVKLNIDNIGDRFKGTYIVTSAMHVYDSQKKYHTQFTVSAMHSLTVMNLLASEPPPRVGLAIGIVTENNDPKGLGRVKVRYPSLEDPALTKKNSDWARVVSVGAGAERGLEFLPEINDEVLIGFEHGDIHQPYVLGGLWNGKDKPPKPTSGVVSSGKVDRRIVRSRTGHVITLDDSSGSPGITVEDSKGNKVQIDTKSGTMTLEASNAIEIKSKKITINGSTLVEIDGAAIKLG